MRLSDSGEYSTEHLADWTNLREISDTAPICRGGLVG